MVYGSEFREVVGIVKVGGGVAAAVSLAIVQ